MAATLENTSNAKKVGTPRIKKITPKKAIATHPPTSIMVNNAVKNLKERGGSSLQAIKKYISSTYKVDAEKVAPFIKKYLKLAVDHGYLLRTKGKGASGSFKLAASTSGNPKKTSAKKTKSDATKKALKLKKAKISPKAKASKTTKKVKKAPIAKKLNKPKPKKSTKKISKKVQASTK